MEPFIEPIKAIILILVGAYISPWVAFRFEKHKRKDSVRLELIQHTHLLFGYMSLYTRHTTIADLHRAFSLRKQSEYEQSKKPELKDEKRLYEEKTQKAMDEAVRMFDSILMRQSEILKLSAEINQLYRGSRYKKFKTIIDDAIKYTDNPENSVVTEDLSPHNYDDKQPAIEERLKMRIDEITKYGFEVNKKLETI